MNGGNQIGVRERRGDDSTMSLQRERVAGAKVELRKRRWNKQGNKAELICAALELEVRGEIGSWCTAAQ